ncbi:MAG: 5-(carboxyamino)imidazole ribonucleotide mutase [Nitrospira sp.]|nr:5-(carboxyamino)imidazole ribonucleotide mutase [Nitrospira sp.]
MGRIKLPIKQPQGSTRAKRLTSRPIVGVLGGSKSDFPVLEKAGTILAHLGIPYEFLVVSAHRTPDRLFEYATTASSRGIQVIIGGAGGAAHLPGMLAAKTHLPVIGVPIPTENLRGLDSLLSIVQMPKGVPVATVAIGGAENAGLLAAQILAGSRPEIAERLIAYRRIQTKTVLNSPEAKGIGRAAAKVPPTKRQP